MVACRASRLWAPDPSLVAAVVASRASRLWAPDRSQAERRWRPGFTVAGAGPVAGGGVPGLTAAGAVLDGGGGTGAGFTAALDGAAAGAAGLAPGAPGVALLCTAAGNATAAAGRPPEVRRRATSPPVPRCAAA